MMWPRLWEKNRKDRTEPVGPLWSRTGYRRAYSAVVGPKQPKKQEEQK